MVQVHHMPSSLKLTGFLPPNPRVFIFIHTALSELMSETFTNKFPYKLIGAGMKHVFTKRSLTYCCQWVFFWARSKHFAGCISSHARQCQLRLLFCIIIFLLFKYFLPLLISTGEKEKVIHSCDWKCSMHFWKERLPLSCADKVANARSVLLEWHADKQQCLRTQWEKGGLRWEPLRGTAFLISAPL